MRTTPALLALVVSSTILLSGCSAVSDILGGGEPVRDDETGEIVEASEADAFALREGDCLNAQEAFGEGATEIETIPTVPCAEPHDGEVYATMRLAGDEFPGLDEAAAEADEFCYAEFPSFVGTSYEDSELDYTLLSPTKASWDLMDDREVACIVVDFDADVTGTMEGAQR